MKVKFIVINDEKIKRVHGIAIIGKIRIKCHHAMYLP